MKLDSVKVGLAVAGGLSITCGTCTKYWEGRDKGLPEPRCTANGLCGSPLAGDAFSQYVGPISNFEAWCFRCGTSTSFIVSVVGKTRRIGVCSDHVQMFNEFRATNQPIDLPEPIIQGEGMLFRPRDLLPKKRKSLIESIVEVEKYYADKKGVEFKL